MAKRGRPKIKEQGSWRLDEDLIARLDRYIGEHGEQKGFKTLVIERGLAAELNRLDGLPVSLRRIDLLLANASAAERKFLAHLMVLMRSRLRKHSSLQAVVIKTVLTFLMDVEQWDGYQQMLAEYGRPE